MKPNKTLNIQVSEVTQTYKLSYVRNTWWISRPKRFLAPVQGALIALAGAAEGIPWTKENSDEIEQNYERQLELQSLKREGERRDRGGSGARTYRAWLKSLGLVFMDSDERLQLTSAGEAIVHGERIFEQLTRQVYYYQYPSAFTYSGQSAVDPRFRVRPFVLILQLLLDDRLKGFLRQSDDVAKIALCYGTSNNKKKVDDLVERIIEHRKHGDSSLEADYLKRFASTRSKEDNLQTLFKNLDEIANTMSNWLRYTQLVEVRNDAGDVLWEIAVGARAEAERFVNKLADAPLIKDPDNEVVFQRRYGLKPGQRKDTRNLMNTKTVTPKMIQEQEITTAFISLSSERIIAEITEEVVADISDATGIDRSTVGSVLQMKFPRGASEAFLSNYLELSARSKDKATEFEVATAEIFRKIFGFEAEHTGNQGLRPDVVLSSTEAHYGAIIDNKAYKKGYSLGVSQQGRMRDYIEDFSQYRLSEDEERPAFFVYVIHEGSTNLTSQIQALSEKTGVNGSAITARDILLMVRRHQEKPFTHEEIRRLFSQNQIVSLLDDGYEGLGDRVLGA